MLDAGQAGRRVLPISESETCHCWAGVVARHLTSSTAKQITEGTAEAMRGAMAPYKNPADLQHFRENLRKAGLPE